MFLDWEKNKIIDLNFKIDGKRLENFKQLVKNVKKKKKKISRRITFLFYIFHVKLNAR